MRLYNRNGFTLVEVMIALVVIGLAITPLLITESNVMNATARATAMWRRFTTAHHFLITNAAELSADQPTLTLENQSTRPSMTMKFSAQKVADSSSVAAFKQLYVQRVTYEWQEGAAKKQETLQKFVVMPEAKKA